MSDGKLLPCPFCGNAPTLKREDGLVGIVCGPDSDCDHTGLCIVFPEAKEADAIECWNRRVAPVPHTHELASAAASYETTIRARVIEEAAIALEQHDRMGREWVRGSLWDTLTREGAARIRALASQPHSDIDDLRQSLGEALSTKLYELMDNGQQAFDACDAYNIDMLLDEIMPLIDGSRKGNLGPISSNPAEGNA